MLPTLKLLYLVRLSHVKNLITYLLNNLNVPLLWVTVLRNGAVSDAAKKEAVSGHCTHRLYTQ